MTLFFAVALVPFYAVGFVMLYQGWADIRQGVGARTWPMVSAHWKACVLEHQASERGVNYRVRVAYTYQVAGRQYLGDNVAIGYVGSGAREAHAALHQRLLDLQPFVVRYCPGHPEVSTILPAENALVYGTLVWSLGWLAATTVAALGIWVASGHGMPFLVWASNGVDAWMGR